MTKAEKTKKRILEEAIILVSEKGYASTATKEIAAKAEVSEATLFKYYGTKENLLNVILMEVMHQLKEETRKGVIEELIHREDLGAREKMEWLFEERLQFFKEHHNVMTIVVQEIAINHEIKKMFRENVMPFIIASLGEIIEVEKKRGHFGNIDTRTIVAGYMNILLMPIVMNNMTGTDQKWIGEEDQHNILKAFLDGLLAG